MKGKKFEDKVRGAMLSAPIALSAEDRPVGVALSGGADSVALLAVLRALGYDCVALHCNFHLRGAESDMDMAIAMSVAKSLGADWQEVHFDVASRKAETGESVEMACRELRYEWFEKMYREYDLSAIAVAHHRDDRIETFLLNATRGTGLRGLVSMRQRRDIFIRPLLSCIRSEIESYLKHRGLEYAVDSSNLTDNYRRNRIRHYVLPSLESVRGDALERMSDTIEHLDDTRLLYDYMLEIMRGRYETKDGTIDLIRLLSECKPIACQLLYELVSRKGLSMSQTKDIILAANESGRHFGPYLLDRGHLILDVNDCVPDLSMWVPWKSPLSMGLIGHDEFIPSRNPDMIYLDSAALDGNPKWELRIWRCGDRICPFGMRGTRLVSDLLSDAKISMADKRRVLVLVRNGVVLWVVGIRASDHYKVTGMTASIVRIVLTEPKYKVQGTHHK